MEHSRVVDALEILRAALGQQTSDITVRDIWGLYATAEEHLHRDWPTECGRADHVLAFCGDRQAQSLMLEDIDAYRKKRREERTRFGRPPTPATVNREVALLRHLMNWAVKRRRLPMNPIWGVEMEDERNIRQTAPSEEEIERIGERAPWFVDGIIRLARYTGMRRDECRLLGWRSVRLDEANVYLGAEETKNGRPRRVILSAKALALLSSLPRATPYVFGRAETGKPYDPTTIHYHFRKACELADAHGVGSETIRIHDTRHGFIRDARRKGIPESTIMRLTGHKTRSAFARYDISDDKDIDLAREILDGPRRPPQRATQPTKKPLTPNLKGG